jgi:hypothetical protein
MGFRFRDGPEKCGVSGAASGEWVLVTDYFPFATAMRRVGPARMRWVWPGFGGVVVCLVSIKWVRSAVCAGGERTAFGLAEDDGLRGRQSLSPPASR